MTEPDSFTPRPYPDIVRDLLTTLTGGTVRETAVVPAGDVIVLATLADRPIRRVSHLQGVIDVQRPIRDAAGEIVRDARGDAELETVPVPFRFTDADFEVIATGAAGSELDAVRFRPNGHRPPTGSLVTVNYYPTQTRPAPITDLNVGSVTRTMLESVARELAVEELLLENVYRSAFVETAEGSNLDKVVALVGVQRRPPGVATVRVRFSRAPGSTGRITVPTNTVVTDGDGNRYATTAPLVLEPGEPSREILCAAVSRSTPAVAAATLNQLEVLIAGVAGISNEAPAAAAAAPETDDELRRRARSALAVAARGTVDALRFGLLSVPGVKDVTVTEFPRGVPGEIDVTVAYERPGDAALEAEVRDRIEDLRPAGVRVRPIAAAAAPVTVTAALTLAGSGLPAAELPTLQTALEERLDTLVRTIPPGGSLRQAQAAQAALADPRVVDAMFEFAFGGVPSGTVTAAAGAVFQLVRPVTLVLGTESGAGLGSTIQLDALVPVHLLAGVTVTEATEALQTAAGTYARGLAGGSTITVDGLVAALRDDSRYAIVRAQVSLRTEAGDRFLQLADGVGAQPVGPADQVALRSIGVDVREGGV